VVGTNNAISTGPNEPCGLWSGALWDHPNEIAYQSRHDSNALFEPLDMMFDIRPTNSPSSSEKLHTMLFMDKALISSPSTLLI
jgi:hypothetical protein